MAYRILNCGERTVCRDLAYFRKMNIVIPLRSTVKDIGRTLSHRLSIIKLWAQGKEYSEISRQAYHSLKAVQNYVDKFKRSVLLSREGYDTKHISFLLRLSQTWEAPYEAPAHDLVGRYRGEIDGNPREPRVRPEAGAAASNREV